MDKLSLLSISWSKIASPYRKHFVSRFLPWIEDAINALVKEKPDPKGAIFVPGCGTGKIFNRDHISPSRSLAGDQPSILFILNYPSSHSLPLSL
jgi:hypothetical protein